MTSVLLWILLVVVGLPMLLIAICIMLAKFAVTINNTMSDPEWQVAPPEELANVPALKLRILAADLEAQGYAPLVGYSVPKMAAIGIRNYVFVFLSPDRQTYGEVFYIRQPLLILAITLLFDRKNFFTSIVSAAFYSAWEDQSRLATARQAHTVANSDANDVSQVLENRDLAGLIAAHQTKLGELIADRGAPMQFATLENYREFFIARTKKIHQAGPKSVEEVLEQNDEFRADL